MLAVDALAAGHIDLDEDDGIKSLDVFRIVWPLMSHGARTSHV